MMRHSIRLQLIGLFLVLVVGVIVTPSAVFAKTSGLLGQVTDANACERLTDIEQKVQTLIADREAAYSSKKMAALQSLITSRAQKDAALLAARAKSDAKLIKNIDAFSKTATTPVQKSAVAEFKQTLTTAITVRRNAIDVANQTARSAIDDMVNTRKTALAASFSTLKKTVSDTFLEAQTRCSLSEKTGSIRSAVSQTLVSAKDDFTRSLPPVTELQNELGTIEKTRTLAITEADAAFSSTYTQALATLKTSFGR